MPSQARKIGSNAVTNPLSELTEGALALFSGDYGFNAASTASNPADPRMTFAGPPFHRPNVTRPSSSQSRTFASVG